MLRCLVRATVLCAWVTIPVIAQGTIRIGIDLAEPWKCQDAKGQLSGAEIEFLRVLAQKLGLQPDFKVYPFKRCLAYLETGDIDLMSGLLKLPEREAFTLYLAPPYKTRSNKAFYVRQDSGITLSRYEDLRAWTIGLKSGVTFFPRFDADPNLRKVEGQSFDQLIRMLIGKRFDVLAMTESVGDYWIRQLDTDQQITKATYKFSQENDVFLGLSRKSPLAPRAEEISRTLARMIQSGELNRIFTAYFTSQGIPVPDYQ